MDEAPLAPAEGSGHGPWGVLALDERVDLLEAIFRVADLEALKTFRLVCKLWNREVVRVLKRRKMHVMNTLAKSRYYYSEGCDLFYSTLRDSCFQECLFSAARIKICSSPPSAVTLALESFKHLLEYVSVLGLTSLSFPINFVTMMQSFKDLNLKGIRIQNLGNMGGVSLGTREQYNDENPVKLIELALKRSQSSWGLERLQDVEAEFDLLNSFWFKPILINMLRSTPSLTRLWLSLGYSIRVDQEQGGHSVHVWEEFDVMRWLHGLSQQWHWWTLESFSLLALKVPGLSKAISSLPFSEDALKSLQVKGEANFSDPSFPEFVTMLMKFSSFRGLRKLTILKCNCHTCEWRSWNGGDDWRRLQDDIPIMPSVTDFALCTNGSFRVASVSVLKKFPNLKTLQLNWSHFGHFKKHNEDTNSHPSCELVSFDYFFDDFQDPEMQDSDSCQIVDVARNIQELRIQHAFNKMSSLTYIQQHFQNLKTLTVTIKSGITYCWEANLADGKMSLSFAMGVFSKLQVLEKLYVNVQGTFPYSTEDILKSMNIIRDFKGLRQFHLLQFKKTDLPQYSSTAPFILKDAENSADIWPIFDQLGSPFKIPGDSFMFNPIQIKIANVCSCNLRNSSSYLTDLRQVLGKLEGYYLNWWCNKQSLHLAKYGTKTFEDWVPLMKRKNDRYRLKTISHS